MWASHHWWNFRRKLFFFPRRGPSAWPPWVEVQPQSFSLPWPPVTKGIPRESSAWVIWSHGHPWLDLGVASWLGNLHIPENKNVYKKNNLYNYIIIYICIYIITMLYLRTSLRDVEAHRLKGAGSQVFHGMHLKMNTENDTSDGN